MDELENKDELSSYDLIDILPLDKTTNKIAENIINETDSKELEKLVQMFNLNQAKKNVIRVLKLNSLLDKVSDQMLERFEKRAGEFNNTELLNYLNVIQNSIDRANKSLTLVDNSPAIQFNQVNVKVEDTLDADSRAKIREAVEAILKKTREVEQNQEIEIIPDTVETVEDNLIENNSEDEEKFEAIKIKGEQ